MLLKPCTVCEMTRVGILTVGIIGTVGDEQAGEGKAGTGNTKHKGIK